MRAPIRRQVVITKGVGVVLAVNVRGYRFRHGLDICGGSIGLPIFVDVVDRNAPISCPAGVYGIVWISALIIAAS